MDRFQYKEEIFKSVGKCYCDEELYENDEVYCLDGNLICDIAECFATYCKKEMDVTYGKLNKYGELN